MPKAIVLATVLIAFCSTALSSQAQDFDPSLPGQQQILEGTEPMPEIIEIWDDQQYPWFVAAEKVFLPSGEFDDTLASDRMIRFEPSVVTALERCRPGECADLAVLSSIDEHTMLGQSLEESLENSESVLEAKVSGLRAGVQGSSIGLAVRIENLSILSGPGPRSQVNYVFLRGGEFQVWGKSVCSSNPLGTELPRLGERVLVLLGSSFQNREKNALMVNAANVVPIRREPVRLGAPYSREASLEGLSGLEFLLTAKRLLGIDKP